MVVAKCEIETFQGQFVPDFPAYPHISFMFVKVKKVN